MDMANAGNGIGAAFASGIGHGSACVGCCWALMTIMFAVGVMNVPAMIGLASVIFLEKLWRRGPLLARLAGGAFLVVALVAAAHPATLGGLRPGDMVMPAVSRVDGVREVRADHRAERGLRRARPGGLREASAWQ
jgi:hypothetical protein